MKVILIGRFNWPYGIPFLKMDHKVKNWTTSNNLEDWTINVNSFFEVNLKWSADGKYFNNCDL